MIGGLTPRQRDVLEFILRFISEHDHAPSLQEIGQHLGMTSVATVHKHLTNLQIKGYLARDWNMSRSLRVLAQPHARASSKAAVVTPKERRDVMRAIQDLQRASLRLMKYVNRGASRAQVS